jgi:hypothetical protein
MISAIQDLRQCGEYRQALAAWPRAFTHATAWLGMLLVAGAVS